MNSVLEIMLMPTEDREKIMDTMSPDQLQELVQFLKLLQELVEISTLYAAVLTDN